MKSIWIWLSVENNRNVLSFLGTGVAVIIAGFWTYFTYFNHPDSKVKNAEPVALVNTQKPAAIKEQPNQIIEQPVSKPTPIPAPVKETVYPKSFSGTYIGISTEGVERLPIKIHFIHQGNNISGTYTLSGEPGEMRGIVNGNTFEYVWQLGMYSGRGISFIKGKSIEGTWGYDNSNSNAGTLTAHLQ